MEEIKAEGQQIIFSGVGAHHMNGVAERSTRTTTTKSQTMMLHSMLRWPDQTDIKLWPFAMNHATCLNNIMSRRTLAHCLAWSCDSQQTSNNSSHSTADCNCSCHTHSLQHCTSMIRGNLVHSLRVRDSTSSCGNVVMAGGGARSKQNFLWTRTKSGTHVTTID